MYRESSKPYPDGPSEDQKIGGWIRGLCTVSYLWTSESKQHFFMVFESHPLWDDLSVGTKSVGPTIKQHFFFGFVLTWVKDHSKYMWIKCPDSLVLKFVHALIFRSFSSSDLSSVQAPLFSSPWYQSTTVSGMLSRFSGNKPSWILSLLPVICAYGMLYNTDIVS